ncbi:hypothetical protein [Trichlorobacter lovleyi]|jgi:hypothetical protein|nr:hypothetical protein [Trichlorobacter lovleyi]
MALSDSRLTVVRNKNVENGFVNIPSDTEICHQNDFGIKLHVMKSDRKRGRRDIVASVAGAVSLGLQSIIHLEAVIIGLLGGAKFDQLIEIIDETIDNFWRTAYDKEIEYLFMLADDSGRTRIFEKIGTPREVYPLEEVPNEHGVYFGVIGDRKNEIKGIILCEVNKLLICKPRMPIETALEIACVRAIRREIEDPQNLLVGGNIQAAAMKGHEGYYLSAQYDNHLSFRSASYPSQINISRFPLMHPLWPFNSEIYNPRNAIEEIQEHVVTDC